MARDTLSKKNSGNARSGQAAAAGRGKPLTLILAGATAVAIVAIAAFAVISTAGGGGGGGAEVEGFTPNDEGLIPAGRPGPGLHRTDGRRRQRLRGRRRRRPGDHAGLLRHLVPALQPGSAGH